jgi:hypothetical protein
VLAVLAVLLVCLLWLAVYATVGQT